MVMAKSEDAERVQKENPGRTVYKDQSGKKVANAKSYTQRYWKQMEYKIMKSNDD